MQSKELEAIYRRCDVSNNRTDDPMSFADFALWHTAEIERARLEGAIQATATIISVGKDDFTWEHVTPEVLSLLPEYAVSTADIPRGKKKFLDFMLEALKKQLQPQPKKEESMSKTTCNNCHVQSLTMQPGNACHSCLVGYMES